MRMLRAAGRASKEKTLARKESQRGIALPLIIAVAVAIGIAALVVFSNTLQKNVLEKQKQLGVQPPRQTGSSVGELAPDFSLQTVQGSSASLSQYRGSKAVLVNFWATWCPPCKQEMPEFQKLRDAKKDFFEVLGVNLQEDAKKVREFALQLNISYPLLLDPSGDAKKKYNVVVQPVSVLVSRNGTVLFRRNGIVSDEEAEGLLAQLVEQDARQAGGAAQPTAGELDGGGQKFFGSGRAALEPVNSGEQVVGENESGHLQSFDPTKIVKVLSPDRIPSIDAPKFVAVPQAGFVKDDELVLGVEYNGVAKAFPYSIMVWHEVANDFFNGVPVLVTYCPLCGTGIVFHRTIGGGTVEFGTSGSLYNSNLLMYDRSTNSLWYQASATAVVGRLAGLKLRIIPSEVVKFGDWKKSRPDSLVLSRETGFERSYGSSPYGGYDSNGEVLFPTAVSDNRLHPKALVQGVEFGGEAKAYPLAEVGKAGLVEDKVGDENIAVVFDPVLKFPKIFSRQLSGKTLSFELKNGVLFSGDGTKWDFDGNASAGPLQGSRLERIAATTAMWFSWANLHPKTVLYKAP